MYPVNRMYGLRITDPDRPCMRLSCDTDVTFANEWVGLAVVVIGFL